MRVLHFAFSAAWAAVLISAAVLVAGPAGAQSSEDSLNDLNRRIQELHRAGKHAEAVPLAERYVALARKQYGEERTEFATAISWLGLLYHAQGRYPDAEALFNRSLAIREKALGPADTLVATSLNNLALLYRTQGRYAEAEPLFKRALAITEKVQGSDHPSLAVALNNLADLHGAQGRYTEAEPLYKRALAIGEKALGPDHPDGATRLSNLALLYRAQGRYADAEGLFKRSLAIREKALGPAHPLVGQSLNNLAGLYHNQGRYAEAETLNKRALAIRESALGLDHPDVGQSLNNLAGLYRDQGRYAEAEPLYKRVLTIREKALGHHHPDLGTALNNLALTYSLQARYAEAEPLHKRALYIREKALGPDHPAVGQSLGNLASVYRQQGRYSEAEPLDKRGLAIGEKALGPDHPDVATWLSNLAGLYHRQARYAEAEPLFKRALAIREKALGVHHPDMAASFNNLAWLYFDQGDWKTAAKHWQQSTDVLILRSRRGVDTVGATVTSQGKSEAERKRHHFWGLIKATHRLSGTDNVRLLELSSDTFKTAQWGMASEAAASLAQMAARQAKGEGALARLVREQQDLVGEWQTRDKTLIAARSQPPDQRNAAAEAALSTRLAAIDTRIGEIDRALAKDFAEYAALANPEPLAIGQVQANLGSDEALLLFLDTPKMGPTPEETFIWVVTKTDTRWVHSELGIKALTERVAALRCGLDQASWNGEGARRCSGMLKGAYTGEDARAGKPLPFDLSRAHELYQALFGQIQDLIKDKHLLVVPSGPLTALPFQVLVTKEPAAAIAVSATAYADAEWLAKSHSITVLPSVASLKALREFAKASKATRPFIGFGNPLLLGPDGNDRRAWERQSCKAPSAPVQVASRAAVRSAIPKFFRSGLANVEEVRAQYPLPETADEICAVAQSSGAGEGNIYLGEKASEKIVKALSVNGTLATARVVHFATHGLLAGETEFLTASKSEPALLLTPPQIPTDEDDGLLTASEIAQLRLDADWVVLSACNTAAGESDRPGTEALSGLARAFFYAGSRALLVSHWAVDSEATVTLITKAFDEIKADAKIGRAEALRRSMLALTTSGGRNAHPANWAPFVVVGEGAR